MPEKGCCRGQDNRTSWWVAHLKREDKPGTRLQHVLQQQKSPILGIFFNWARPLKLSVSLYLLTLAV
jgi:hypothetical protein